jgi:thioredoxin-like negative regulator of GroEL
VRQQWGAIEKLAVNEREATRDSLLLGRELALAYERLLQPRKAAQVTVEVWATSPSEAEWAEATLSRLEDMEPRAARDALRKAAAARPGRVDLAIGAARLEWRRDDLATALRILTEADATVPSTPVRWSFAQELLFTGSPKDTSAALEALVSLAADTTRDPAYRLPAARRAWQIYERRGREHDGALRVSRVLADLPPHTWSADLLVGIVRALRESGQTTEVRALLARLGDRRSSFPELALEGALADLRDGPPARALPALEKAAVGSPEGVFRFAEALFFAGMPDSAQRLYDIISHDPKSPYTAPALERLFLIEDADPREALPVLGQMAYEAWRGDARRAAGFADSLYRTLPRGPLWATAALELAGYRDREGNAMAALEPLLAVADSLPGDRLAPVARQRAGDVYRLRLKDDAKAMAQYEECLARYPKAWNAPEVRRIVETYRRERRF